MNGQPGLGSSRRTGRFFRDAKSLHQKRHQLVWLFVGVGLCSVSLSFYCISEHPAYKSSMLDGRLMALVEEKPASLHHTAPVGSGSAGGTNEQNALEDQNNLSVVHGDTESNMLQSKKKTSRANAQKHGGGNDEKTSLTEHRSERNGQSTLIILAETKVDGMRLPSSTVKLHNETGASDPIVRSSLLESPRQQPARPPTNASSNSNAVLVDSADSLRKNNQTKSAFQSATASMKKRLEFLHIPKTGGSSIEAAAAKQGVSWGFCHFVTVWASIENSMGEVTCLDTPNTRRKWRDLFNVTKGCVHWHYPSHRLASLGKLNPYSNASLFAVVRNPYERVISEYYYRGKYVRSLTDDRLHDPKEMNKWIRDRLNQHMKVEKPWGEGYCFPQGHFIPQRQFVYDGQRKVVDHVLHFENLNNEFDELMTQYGLNISLPQRRVFGAEKKLLGVQNLTANTIDHINFVYAEDFSAFGYNKTQPQQ